MKYFFVPTALVLVGVLSFGCSSHKEKKVDSAKTVMLKTQSSLKKITAEWPARPRLAVQEMFAKYGTPKEVSSE
ncbi:MAG: hypothetical protein H0V66_08520, partial [Bdellovibrionales bacterium]|nr:hypothetical protein [Bdellovibrionales bacterium]